MFVTVIRKHDRHAASVHFVENKVSISAGQECLHKILRDIYKPDMNPLEFARANYQLNRLRPTGITWELVLSTEYGKSGN